MKLFCMVLVSLAVQPIATGSDSDQATKKSLSETDRLLAVADHKDIDNRRLAAADICILLLKRNGEWRQSDSLDWKILREQEFRLEASHVRKSDQTEDLAVPNMCAHCMGMLRGGAWLSRPAEGEDSLEQAVAKLAKESKDPAVRALLLLGLASSSRIAARDAVVAATQDAHLGVRKSACYLIERRTRSAFGPIGNIHIGSTENDVRVAGERIRNAYAKDKVFRLGSN